MTKAIVLDTEKLDLAKVAEAFGQSVADQIKEALASAGIPFKTAEAVEEAPECALCGGKCRLGEDEVDEDEVDEDEVDEDEVDEDEDLFNPDYGNVVETNERDNAKGYRLKTVFSVPNTDIDDVTVTEIEDGVTVFATDNNENYLDTEIVPDFVVDPTKTDVVFNGDKLEVRLYCAVDTAKVGREIPVKTDFWA